MSRCAPAGREDEAHAGRFAVWLIGQLVRAYPREFRERFGAGMRHALKSDWLEARRQVKWRWAAVSWFWLRQIPATIWFGWLERLTRRQTGHAENPGTPDTSSQPRPRRPPERRPPGDSALTSLLRDVGLAVRRLRRRPGFALAAVGTVGLGIGATTAIFSVVYGVLLRPLPYVDADRIVVVNHRSKSTDRLGMPDGGYLYYAQNASTLEGLAIYTESSVPISGAGEPLELGIIEATPSLFPVLGVSAERGRLFGPEDAMPGAPTVVVVSHGYWVRRLGSDPGVVGSPLPEDPRVTIIGVLPADFEFVRARPTVAFGNRFEAPDLFVPMTNPEPSRARFGNFMYQAIGRLAPGADAPAAGVELGRLMYEAPVAFPGSEERGGYSADGLREAGFTPVVTPLKQAIVGGVADVLWVLMAAVSLVLAIALANVANLFLVRADARRQDLAVERALGADGRHVIRSSLSESFLLAGAGGLVGVWLTWAGVRGLLRLAPHGVPRLAEVGVRPEVLLFALALSVLAGIAFGIIPVLRAGRLDVGAEISRRSRAGGEAGPGRFRRDALIVGQVALALVLVTASGLLFRTFLAFREVDPGFEPDGVLLVTVSPGSGIVSGAGYTGGPSDITRSRFMVDLVDRLRSLPGVQEAAFTADVPLDAAVWRDYVATEDAWPAEPERAIMTQRVFIGPRYLETIGARFREGRELEAREFAGQPRSAVVNRTFAEQRWPGGSPIGRRITQYWSNLDPTADIWYTVVGVVDDIHEVSLMEPAEPTVYLPTAFLPEGGFGVPVTNMVIVLRASGDAAELVEPVRQSIHDFNAELPIDEVTTLAALTARSFEQVTFAMLLLGVAGIISAVLALIGIYGTVAYVVSRRTREFGVRMALGASTSDVLLTVLLRAARIGAAGIVLGALVAAASGRILESLLFGVATVDPLVYGAAATALFSLVLLASFAPAARAAAVDPVTAMRVER